MPIYTIEPVLAVEFRINARETNGTILGRSFVVVAKNAQHAEPFGLLEDVFVEEPHRGRGIGSELIDRAIALARSQSCYKFIATSRYGRDGVHKMYLDKHFTDHGKEFRMDF